MKQSLVGMMLVLVGLGAPGASAAQDQMAAVRQAIDAQNRAWAEATKAGDAAAVVQTDQVMLDGPTVIEYGHYASTYPPKNGQPQVDSGRYVVVWRRQADGAWRILVDMGLPAPE